ncbi:hypothetical protein JP02758_1721 [Staphylococcus aureus]|nr:hypothetical protein JP02758_1721 [Staphylococcus aureus]
MRYIATWEMEEIVYLHLEDEDKEDILYFEKQDDKVIAVTNILWTCKELFNFKCRRFY